ncbi:MAG: DUF1540 domain-containing protein [Oscillospiraceae bacterium]|nr:DUF1540 domain-containing protein [Oscillospiraceae bacterium]
MTNLKCSVENCANYKEHRCCLPNIEVRGEESDSRYETCCASFVSKQEGVTNVVRHDDPNTELEIRCTAEKCVHHCHGDQCDANCVCVGTYSYDTQRIGETQCETFANTKLKNIHDE